MIAATLGAARILGAAAAFSVIFATSIQSQTVTGSVDLTAANTRYGDTFTGNSFSFSPALHVDAPSALFDAGGSYSTLAGNWTAQGNLGTSLFTPRVSSLMGELAAYAGASANGDGSRTGSFTGMGRAHLLNGGAGAWLGAGGGRVWDGVLWRNLLQAEAGAWKSIPYGTITAVVTPSRMADTIRYTDAEGMLSVFHDRLGVDASVGFRTGSSLPILGGATKAWGNVSGAYWVTNGVAVIASAGNYPVNFGEGFPGGRYISAGVRLGARPSSDRIADLTSPEPAVVLPPSDIATGATSSPVPSESALRVTSTRAGETRFEIAWPSARTVEIAGDFSNWDPIAMTRNGAGSWTASLPLKPGIYEMNIRVDGGGWLAPAGIPSKNDEFGQSVGVLILPRR